MTFQLVAGVGVRASLEQIQAGIQSLSDTAANNVQMYSPNQVSVRMIESRFPIFRKIWEAVFFS